MSETLEPLLQLLAGNVRDRRGTLALTLREVAEMSGVSQRFLVSLEAGKANVSVLKLAAVADALETTTSALLLDVINQPSSRQQIGRPLALLGLRGAGKSAIGRRVAERLALPFVELDGRVADLAGMTLPGIFALHGADYYRRLETQALIAMLAQPSASIVATGGGIVTNHRAYGMLQRGCVTVFLQATAEHHWNRVAAQGDARPTANRSNAMDELRTILRARRALYERAEHVVDTSALGLERSVDAVVRIARGV